MGRKKKFNPQVAPKPEVVAAPVEEAKSFEDAESVPEVAGPGPVDFLPGIRLSRKNFKGKKSKPAEDLKWVAECMYDGEVTEKEAPSAVAWGLLMTCRKNPAAFQDFWLSIYPKMLPTKAQFEAEEKMRGDDGKSIIELCDRFKKAVLGEGCEI